MVVFRKNSRFFSPYYKKVVFLGLKLKIRLNIPFKIVYYGNA